MLPKSASAVVSGICTSRLRSRPTRAEPEPPARPTGRSTPTTRKTRSSMRNSAPIGSSSRKSFLAISDPITATGARDAMSSSVR